MRVAVPLEQCWHDVPGGTARTTIDLASALAARDDVEVIGVSARHAGPPAEAWRPTVPVEALGLPRLALYEAWHGLRRPLVERATGPVDVLHVVGGAVAASRAPMVVTIHDLAFEHHPGMFTRHGLRFLRRALRLATEEAALVLTPSRTTLEDCVAHGIERARLRHVPWGVHVADPGCDLVQEVRDRHGIGGDYVVMVGTLEPRKNLRGMLRAWRLLARDDVELVVVGPTGWGDVLDGEDVPRGVRLTGFVSDAERDALYRGALASVYPSLMEGFGLPVLEAMALGCPVVTSAGTATEELVEGGAGVTVDPTDPASIARGLASVLDDDTERARLRAAGSDRAALLTWESTAAQVADAYRSVLA